MNFVEKKDNIFLITSIFIIVVGIILRITAFCSNLYYIPIDDCHSLYDLPETDIKSLFTVFNGGANFLPLYKLMLYLIYKISGFNYLALKIPELIASIFVLPLSLEVLKKLFKNKLIIVSALVMIVFDYNLIYFGTRIKPYIFDVLITLIILNTIIYITQKNITLKYKEAVKYSFVSALFMMFSIPSIVLCGMYFCIFFIKNIIEKERKNIINSVIFLLITVPVIIAEYFFYILQIQQENGLKSQWTADLFYFAPKSLAAVNSLIHAVWFKFCWWDTAGMPLLNKYTVICALAVFVLGSVVCIYNAIRQKDIKDILLILPVYSFLILSYMNIYPFCNRLIVFLIPAIIFITFKPFDCNLNKIIKIVFDIIIILYLVLFLKYMNNLGEVSTLLFNDSMQKMIFPVIENLSNLNNKDNVIINCNSVCITCINNNNVIEIREVDKNKLITIYDRRNNCYYQSEDINEITKNKKNIYYATSENYSDDKQVYIEELIGKQGYSRVETRETPFVNYTLYSKTDN